MYDICERLRSTPRSDIREVMCEAAAEIARLRLTAAERSAIRDAADRYASLTPESAATAATLRGLLDRTGSR